MIKRLGILVAATTLFLLATSTMSAMAHTTLVASTPMEGAILQEFPREILLEFNEPLLTLGGNRSNYFELISPSGEILNLSEFLINQSKISASVSLVPEIEGTYEISYRVVSLDGHVVKGTITFEYESPSSNAPETESETPAFSNSAKIPNGVLVGLILFATFVSLSIYAKAGQGSQE